MRRGLAVAMGVGMLAEAFTGAGCSLAESDSPEVTTTTQAVAETAVSSTVVEQSIVDQRKAIALSQVDIEIVCVEEEAGGVLTKPNQKTFKNVAEVTRFGLVIGDEMIGFTVDFNPEIDQLSVGLFAYDFEESDEPRELPRETGTIYPLSDLTHEIIWGSLPPVTAGDGISYELIFGINRPDDVDATFSLICVQR